MDASWLSHDNWVTRDCCGEWPAWLLTQYVVANSAIALAYAAIGIASIRLASSGKFRIISRWHTVGWGAFIVACGFGHAFDAISPIWVNYGIRTQTDTATAVLSVLVAIVFPLIAGVIARQGCIEAVGAQADPGASDATARLVEAMSSEPKIDGTTPQEGRP